MAPAERPREPNVMTRQTMERGSEVWWPTFPPPWAEVFGEDRYGVFAEFALNNVRFVWRWIPAGRFRMGSPKEEAGRWNDEGPQHEVELTRGYWLGETPLTQAQWWALASYNPSHFKGEEHPVESAAFAAIEEFIATLNQRVEGLSAGLPSEAQWEYASRAGTQGAFGDGSECTQPHGKDPALDRLGWYGENSGGRTHAVKKRDPNGWGLYDMHGNIWECCRDGVRKYRGGTEVDPEGELGARGGRVVRGGSWGDRARRCRAAYRGGLGPGGRNDVLGFRLAAGLEPGGTEPPGSSGRRSEG